jgi:hypothetical protein
MLTGELRSKIDQVWNAFWSGGMPGATDLRRALLRKDTRKIVTDRRRVVANWTLANLRARDDVDGTVLRDDHGRSRCVAPAELDRRAVTAAADRR